MISSTGTTTLYRFLLSAFQSIVLNFRWQQSLCKKHSTSIGVLIGSNICLFSVQMGLNCKIIANFCQAFISCVASLFHWLFGFSSEVRGFLEIYPKTKTDNSVKCKNSFVTWNILSSMILLFYSCFVRFFLLKNPWNKLAFCTWIP